MVLGAAGFIAFTANIPETRRRIVVLGNTGATDATVLTPQCVAVDLSGAAMAIS